MMQTQVHKSLMFKIGILVLVLEVVVLSISGVVYVNRFQRELDVMVRDRAQIPARLVSDGLLDIHSITDRTIIESLIGEELIELEESMVIGAQGVVFQATRPDWVGRHIRDLHEIPVILDTLNISKPLQLEIMTQNQKRLINLAPLFFQNRNTVFLYTYIQLNIHDTENRKNAILKFFALGSLAIILFTTIGILLLFYWSFSNRMLLLLSVIRKVSQGDLTVRIKGKLKKDEMGIIQHGMNMMIDALQSSIKTLETRYQQLDDAQNEIKALNRDLEKRVQERTAALETANKELEAFTYSVSHDLRSPLRSIDGFSQALLEDCYDHLDETGKDYLTRVRSASQRMGLLIDGLLKLSRVTRGEMELEEVNLSDMARRIIDELKMQHPERNISVQIKDDVVCRADKRLMLAVMENLIANAWKFTRNENEALIEFGQIFKNGDCVIYLKDNGVGFNMAYVDKLFGEFQRLHSDREFEGTGIGLATVRRIISRHQGNIWVESEEGVGTTFYFTLN